MFNVGSGKPVPKVPSHISVLLVEDSPAFQAYVARLLDFSQDIEVVARAQDGVQAVRYAQEFKPDLILLDIGLPLLNGIEVAKRVLQFAPDSKIIFLTQESSHEFVEEAFNGGAAGYVLKMRLNSDLWPAIASVREGKQFVSPGLRRPAFAFHSGVLGLATT